MNNKLRTKHPYNYEPLFSPYLNCTAFSADFLGAPPGFHSCSGLCGAPPRFSSQDSGLQVGEPPCPRGTLRMQCLTASPVRKEQEGVGPVGGRVRRRPQGCRTPDPLQCHRRAGRPRTSQRRPIPLPRGVMLAPGWKTGPRKQLYQ